MSQGSTAIEQMIASYESQVESCDKYVTDLRTRIHRLEEEKAGYENILAELRADLRKLQTTNS